MRTRDVWVLAAVSVLAGVALLSVADQRDTMWLRFVGMALLIAGPSQAVGFSARRRRRLRREDSPDSVERQASRNAAARSFFGAMVIGGLLMLALLYVPGPVPGLWAIGAWVALPALFWIFYLVELEKLRG